MKTSKFISATLLLLIATAAPLDLRAAEKSMTEKEKIEALIKNLEKLKDATFIRNDRDYDAKTAARFLRGKWRAQEKEIKTAMDFIDKVASVSSTSDKPYVIRIKGAREVKCGEYLKDELKKLEKDKPEKAKAAAEHRLH
jgi:tRNA C32,U32 (ribose-2'-O)-methylase TrmJ